MNKTKISEYIRRNFFFFFVIAVFTGVDTLLWMKGINGLGIIFAVGLILAVLLYLLTNW